jgi:predicted alpha/beta superfamily hydrolase
VRRVFALTFFWGCVVGFATVFKQLSSALVVVLFLAACSDDPRQPASAPDAKADAATLEDAGSPPPADSGEPLPPSDSGEPPPSDSGEPPPDSGEPDAGIAPDSGEVARATLLFRVHVPDTTPAGDTIYIAGNFQNWNPGSSAHALAMAGPYVYEITLSFDPGTDLELKFTRGSWETVEKGPAGEEIANRVYRASADATHEIFVASWADLPPAPSTRTGDITTLTVPGFLNGRRVWVYLPPNYHNTTDEYPVLYMFDGQNVFDAYTSFSGEWEVDETLETLIPMGEVKPMIVVAVDNGGGARLNEYTPWFDATYMDGGGADMHLDAIVDILIPYVDVNYRTLDGPQNTGVSGSSLGGLLTLYATYSRPDVFGLNAALSPSIWWANENIITYAEMIARPSSFVWMDMGTAESPSAIDNLRAMRDLMVMQGFVLDLDLKVVEDQGAAHNEAAWARRFPDVLRFLFPGP